jgi:hypothetical protein
MHYSLPLACADLDEDTKWHFERRQRRILCKTIKNLDYRKAEPFSVIRSLVHKAGRVPSQPSNKKVRLAGHSSLVLNINPHQVIDRHKLLASTARRHNIITCSLHIFPRLPTQEPHPCIRPTFFPATLLLISL